MQNLCEPPEIQMAKKLTDRGWLRTCERCDYHWNSSWAGDPTCCPNCDSAFWNQQLPENHKDVIEIVIKAEQHPHYRYHYNIETSPSISTSKIYDLLLENLKALVKAKPTEKKESLSYIPTVIFESVRHKIIVEAESFQIRAKSRRDSRYSDRLLEISGRDRIHISIERDEGMSFLINAMRLSFPNAVIKR